MTTYDFDEPYLRRDRRRVMVGTSTVLMAMCVLAAIRDPAGLPIFLRALGPLAGVLWFVARPSVDKALLPVYLIGLVGVFSVFQDGATVFMIFKYIQFFAMILMAQFVASQDPRNIPRMIALLIVPVAVVVIPLEIVVGAPATVRSLFGLSLPRFIGLAGLHTHSAFLYMFLAILLVYDRRFIPAAIFVVATLTTGSRGFAAAAAMALAVALIPGRLARTGAVLALILLAASAPLIAQWLNATLAEHEKVYLNLLTTRRFDHWVTFSNMGLANPVLGVGYRQGFALYTQYADAIYGWYTYEKDAHNLYISLWAEWGVASWFVFSAWLAWLALRIGASAPRHLPILAYMTTIYSFHDGLSDWVLWFGVGYLLAIARHSAGAGSQGARSQGAGRPA